MYVARIFVLVLLASGEDMSRVALNIRACAEYVGEAVLGNPACGEDISGGSSNYTRM